MITAQLFNSLFPTKGLDPRKYNLVRYRQQLIDSLNKFLPIYEINTYLRVSGFFGCCGIETDYFKTTAEYASGDDYDTRTDLGNTPARDGDGRKYKGSGLIQTTGRFNFFRVLIRFVKKLSGYDHSKNEKLALSEADRLGVNFIDHPEMLRNNIEIAVEAACIFWQENNLNKYADAGQFKELNGLVNKGSAKKTALHWEKRLELTRKCLAKVPKDFSFELSSSDLTVKLPSNNEPQPTQDLTVNNSAQNSILSNEPNENSFLTNAFDKNISADEVKTVAKSATPKLLGKLARPFGILWAALEAGNIYAWFGVAVLVIGLGLMIYWHRKDLLKIWGKLKEKFTA